MAARIAKRSSVYGDLSADRFYLLCPPADYSETIRTLTTAVGGGYSPIR